MAEISWTDEAQRWLNDIFEYIAADNPQAAAWTVEGIYDRVQDLRRFPELGSRYTASSRNVRILLFGHYRIAHLIKDDGNIDILGMSLLANLGRVLASEEILPTVDESIANEPATTLMLMVSADLHWRRKEWRAAIDMALRILERKPKDFHALSVVATSYGHLQQFDDAYPYAKRLTAAAPPPWDTVKAVLTLLTLYKFVTAKGRASHRRMMTRCNREVQADREALAWAHELISAQRAANDPVAV